MLRPALLALIRLYQRHISPRKGFSCAYRVHTGGRSCSHFGARAIRRHGAFTGLLALRRRLHRCGEVHRQHGVVRRGIGPFAAQRGECDCDVGGCDAPSGRSLGRVCEFVNPCDCLSCDWPSRRKKPDDRRQGPFSRVTGCG